MIITNQRHPNNTYKFYKLAAFFIQSTHNENPLTAQTFTSQSVNESSFHTNDTHTIQHSNVLNQISII